jgi:hypothetical protein
MRARLLAFSLAIACAGAIAAEPPQPQPLAPGGVIAAAKARGQAVAAVVASPVTMVTRAVVLPDGKLGLVCSQQRNPHPVKIDVARPVLEPQQ